MNDLVDLYTCLLMYKASNKMLQQNVQAKFVKNQDVHNYNTRIKGELHVSGAYSNVKNMSTNVRGVRILNHIDNRIKNSTSIAIFKSRLKQTLLKSY